MAVSPDAGEAFARELVGVLAETEREMMDAIARRLERGIDAPSWYEDKIAQVRPLRTDLEKRLAGKIPAIEKAVSDGIARAYGTGAAAATSDMASYGMAAAFAGVNQDAIEAIIQETLGQVSGTHFAILRQTQDAYRDVVSKTAAQIAAGGLTRREASARALDAFAKRGIKGFVDKAGRSWGLDTYAEMTMRTASGRAHVEGALRRYQDLGDDGDLVIFSDSPEECPLCRPWEGKVVSQSGESTKYPPLSAAIRDGMFHPNCTHSMGLYVPGLTEPMTDTENPEGYEDRQKQRHLERKVREWKRREIGSLDPRIKARATARRRGWEDRLDRHVRDKDRKRLPYRTSVKGSKVGAPKVSSVTKVTKAAPTKTAASMGPRGDVMKTDLLPDRISRAADARKVDVFSKAEVTLSSAMKSLDGALYDVGSGVRDLYASTLTRLKSFTYRASSSAGRKKPISVLGETAAKGTRDLTKPDGLAILKDSVSMDIEFRRSKLIDDVVDWNKKARAAQAKGRSSLDDFMRANPPPDAALLMDAAADEISETLIHELTHAIDFLGDMALRKKIVRDGIMTEVRAAYAGGKGDPGFWYAASDPAEGVAELARMYVFGTSNRAVSNTGRALSPEAWRKKYPSMAAWVEENIFGGLV